MSCLVNRAWLNLVKDLKGSAKQRTAHCRRSLHEVRKTVSDCVRLGQWSNERLTDDEVDVVRPFRLEPFHDELHQHIRRVTGFTGEGFQCQRLQITPIWCKIAPIRCAPKARLLLFLRFLPVTLCRRTSFWDVPRIGMDIGDVDELLFEAKVVVGRQSVWKFAD